MGAKNLRYSLPLPMLPIQVRESALVHAIERVTQYGLPTTCAIENNKVRTFDKMVYDYALNNCEHVAFRDCTANPKVMVTLKKTPAQHIVKAVIDHNKYELELVRGGRGRTTGTLKVNGQVMQPMAKVAGRTSLFEDKSNRVVLHEDGVFEIFSLKYGMAVLADHEAVEVKTFQWALRNLACGLCGDMNDEKTADLKSAGKCVMSQPKLAALSYMVEDGQCEGIPAQLKPVYQKEASECKKVEVVPQGVGPLPAHAAPEQGELHAEAHRDRDGPEDLHQQAADQGLWKPGLPQGNHAAEGGRALLPAQGQGGHDHEADGREWRQDREGQQLPH